MAEDSVEIAKIVENRMPDRDLVHTARATKD